VIEKEVEDSILDSNSRREDCPGRRGGEARSGAYFGRSNTVSRVVSGVISIRLFLIISLLW
jgi:hypothetical protein